MYRNLEAELKRKQIRRIDLASELGLALSTVSEKMQGKSEFSLGTAVAIKRMLGVDMPIEVLFATSTDDAETEGNITIPQTTTAPTKRNRVNDAATC